MELPELTAYAEEKFHIHEQLKWDDFPGFSILADPGTGKWIALLMRQWDSDTGTEIQRCDLKCGQESLAELREPYLSRPFRMKGKKWVGVIFNHTTKPDVVFRLFDRAVYSGEPQGYTIVLEDAPAAQMIVDDISEAHTAVHRDTALSFAGSQAHGAEEDVPEQIRAMRRLYRYRSSSFPQKCRNFCRQAKFMEDYEDDAAWTGEYKRYFPTYHDLNTRQLRGYFTWRTHVRKGEFTPVATSLAYLYLYELLNGIGTDSPEDGFEKMRKFETGYLDSGIGDPGMYKNLHRWMLEYAVIHGLPPELVASCVPSADMEKDVCLAVLRTPEEAEDEEIFSALCCFAGKKLEQSAVVRKDEKRGKHLFASVWRYVCGTYMQDGRDFFAACFGKQRVFLWRPFANAVYWQEAPHADADYVLDACRSYHCRGGVWREKRYDKLYFDRKRFSGLLREADRRLRNCLKTGHYLREDPDESWAAEYVEAVLENERQAEIEKMRPKITIELSSLEQIRQDARHTRDSLLTEEEMNGEAVEAEDLSAQEKTERPAEQGTEEPADVTYGALDAVHTKILLELLRGNPIETYLAAGHLMPSVVADTVNEALFDEIGDSVLECDGDTITVSEDYREEVLQILGGKTDE